MWTLGMCAQFLAVLFIVMLVCSVCRGEKPKLQNGDRITINRELLLSLCFSAESEVPTNIPAEIYVPFHPDKGSPRQTLRHKRGRRGGIHCKMKKLCLDNPRQLPPLPSVFLSNVQSLRSKVDELEFWAKYICEITECCLLAITETWLNESNQDGDLSLTRFGCPIRLDRSSEATGKNRGGGFCFYVNQR